MIPQSLLELLAHDTSLPRELIVPEDNDELIANNIIINTNLEFTQNGQLINKINS
jgi:hypothetical protein